jgi:hypothetical protein
MRNLTTLAGSTIIAGGLVAGGMLAANADHGDGFGDWQPIPAHMVGDHCDTIDGGSPAIVTLGEHALFHDTAGTRFVITMPGRVCSS